MKKKNYNRTNSTKSYKKIIISFLLLKKLEETKLLYHKMKTFVFSKLQPKLEERKKK